MPKNSGLGKGLSSLIPPKIDKKILPKSSLLREEDRILHLPTNQIKTNPHQPRQDFSYSSLEELINSIKEYGILQPLIVTKTKEGYQLIAGERRLKAAQFLELKTVSAIIREAKEQQQLEISLIENIQRQNLNPIEEAVAYQRLIDEFNLTQEQVAEKVGKSRPVVANTLRLLSLPTEIQKALISGKINYTTGRILAGLPPKKRLSFFYKILKSDLTIRAIEGESKKIVIKRHPKIVRDPEIANLEEVLRQTLGTKVTIKKSGKTGQIIIEFYSVQDLKELIKRITQK